MKWSSIPYAYHLSVCFHSAFEDLPSCMYNQKYYQYSGALFKHIAVFSYIQKEEREGLKDIL